MSPRGPRAHQTGSSSARSLEGPVHSTALLAQGMGLQTVGVEDTRHTETRTQTPKAKIRSANTKQTQARTKATTIPNTTTTTHANTSTQAQTDRNAMFGLNRVQLQPCLCLCLDQCSTRGRLSQSANTEMCSACGSGHIARVGKRKGRCEESWYKALQ